MKIKKLMLFALPVMALSVGIVALNTPKASEDYSTVEAADYTHQIESLLSIVMVQLMQLSVLTITR